MMNRVERLARAPQDKEAWQHWYYKTQQDYLRKRLKGLAYLWEGHTLEATCRRLGIQSATWRRWADKYLHGGFESLLQPITHEKPQRLSPQRKKLLRFILTHHTPVEYGFDTYVWTEPCVRSLLEQKWQVVLEKTRVYEILDELNLSHQRVRREYINRDPKARKVFVQNIKNIEDQPLDEVTLFFDEFGLARVTHTHYAWSLRNHRPGIPSDESHKGDRLNGLLAVDVRSGETFLEFYERNHSMTVAEYFVILCLLLIGRGYKTIRLVLDTCASHQEKMRKHFNKLLKYILQDLFSIVEPTIQFIYTPPYSPDLNLAEYFIHHLRQHSLYHTPPTLTVQQKADRIATKLKEKPIQTPQQTHNTLQHIYQLVRL